MKCLICNKNEAKIKYCSNPCAYKAMDLKTKERRKKIHYVNCIACQGKGKVKRIIRSIITDTQKKNILKLYRKGYGIREIQRELKLANPYTVTYYIKTCNIK